MANIRRILSLAILLIWIVHSESACPHGLYLYKHVCYTCNDEKSALAFSKLRRGSGLNTVFTGNVYYYERNSVDGRVCEMVYSLPAYKCNLNAKNPYCKYLGNKKGYHATSTGHLFYNKLV